MNYKLNWRIILVYETLETAASLQIDKEMVAIKVLMPLKKF
jgi:hypothetical protein